MFESLFSLKRTVQLVCLAILASVQLRELAVHAAHVRSGFSFWLLALLALGAVNTCIVAFLSMIILLPSLMLPNYEPKFSFVHFSVAAASQAFASSHDHRFAVLMHLLNLFLLTNDLAFEVMAAFPHYQLGEGAQPLGLQLPAVGSVIHFSEQGKIITSWMHKAGEAAEQQDRRPEEVLAGDNIVLGDVIGAGSFGRVFVGKTICGREFAVKIIDHGESALASVSRETKISMQVDHPNVVKTLHFFTTVNREAAAAPTGLAERTASNMMKDQQAGPSGRNPSSSSGWLGGWSVDVGRKFGGAAAAAGNMSSLIQIGIGGSQRGTRGSGFHRPSGSAWTQGSSRAPSQGFLMDIVGSRCTAASLKPVSATHSTWIIQELCSGGSLASKLRQELQGFGGLEEGMQAVMECGEEDGVSEVPLHPDVINAAKELKALERLLEIMRGLDYLHKEGICHGDIKAQNVLVFQPKPVDGVPQPQVLKLADFGLSRILNTENTHHSTYTAGTVTHSAPELLTLQRMNAATDVYAFGILMFEVATGLKLYEGYSSAQIVLNVVSSGLRPDYGVASALSDEFMQLSARCWSLYPEARPTDTKLIAELEDLIAKAKARCERSNRSTSQLLLPS